VQIFPHGRLTLTSSLSPAEAHRRLVNAVGPRTFGHLVGSATTSFTGDVSAEDFAVRRVGVARNSFTMPAIGRIVPTPTGVIIEVEFSIVPVIRVMLTAWLCVMAVMLVGLVAFAVSRRSASIQGGLCLFGIYGLVWLLILAIFRMEVARAEFELRKLFTAWK